MDERVLVTNVQRFSIHDGPGIRTTVFLKGCSLHCPWCANPENISPMPERYKKDGRDGIWGKYYSCEELYDEIRKEQVFYKQKEFVDGIGMLPGGVTFSGGEPLLQFNRLAELLDKLSFDKIHICAETCLFVPRDQLAVAIKYVDLFYVDVKILNPDMCRSILGGNLKQYYSNLDMLFCAGKTVIFRIPVIGGYTDRHENMDAILGLLGMYSPTRVELLKEHNLGTSKYISLGVDPPVLNGVLEDTLLEIKSKIENNYFIKTEICRV